MSDWYSRLREEDGRTDEEVMAGIDYARDAKPLTDDEAVSIVTALGREADARRCWECRVVGTPHRPDHIEESPV